jgi:hypothetical protein
MGDAVAHNRRHNRRHNCRDDLRDDAGDMIDAGSTHNEAGSTFASG